MPQWSATSAGLNTPYGTQPGWLSPNPVGAAPPTPFSCISKCQPCAIDCLMQESQAEVEAVSQQLQQLGLALPRDVISQALLPLPDTPYMNCMAKLPRPGHSRSTSVGTAFGCWQHHELCMPQQLKLA